jgi:hypothetical protein
LNENLTARSLTKTSLGLKFHKAHLQLHSLVNATYRETSRICDHTKLRQEQSVAVVALSPMQVQPKIRQKSSIIAPKYIIQLHN